MRIKETMNWKKNRVRQNPITTLSKFFFTARKEKRESAKNEKIFFIITINIIIIPTFDFSALLDDSVNVNKT